MYASSNSQKYQSSKSQNLSDAFLGSSLYYGGRDLYHDPSTVKTEGIDKVGTQYLTLVIA